MTDEDLRLWKLAGSPPKVMAEVRALELQQMLLADAKKRALEAKGVRYSTASTQSDNPLLRDAIRRRAAAEKRRAMA